ncbi:MAG: PaaI family thioesterase [Trebonia sp.]
MSYIQHFGRKLCRASPAGSAVQQWQECWVQGNTQPYGMLHGGASVVLAESLGSAGTALHAGPGSRVVGLEVNATHHRPVAAGHVTGTATAIRGGSSVATYEVVITDDEGRRICTSRVTCLIKPTTAEKTAAFQPM